MSGRPRRSRRQSPARVEFPVVGSDHGRGAGADGSPLGLSAGTASRDGAVRRRAIPAPNEEQVSGSRGSNPGATEATTS